MAGSQHNSSVAIERLETEQTIKECDQELENYRAALKASPSETAARWIVETEQRKQLAERQLKNIKKPETLTATDIRNLVKQMNGIVQILDNATMDDRRKVYEAARLKINYNHNKKAVKIESSPHTEAWGLERVGGGT